MKGARASLFQRWRWILVFRLVATLGKYTFRILNACLFVDCSIENGTGEVKNSNIRFSSSRAFVNHRIRENRLAIYLRLLAGLP